MTRPAHPDLVAVLRRRAEAMVGRNNVRDRQTAIVGVVRAAVETVPDADGGSITTTVPPGPSSGAATDEGIVELDELQVTTGQGPSVDAAERPPEAGIVVDRDLASDAAGARWPAFAARAVEVGYRSVLAVQLGLTDRQRSALTLYSRRPDAFDAAAETIAGLFGVQAALLLHGADHVADLQRALETRDAIGQAKGILMERFGIDDGRAFQMLVESSQQTNMKLADVARWLLGERAGHERHSSKASPEPA